MPFTTNAELQTAIASWLARDDLTAYIPDYIRLFEAAAARKLKVRLQEATVTLTPVSGVATVPSDCLGYRRVTWTGSPRIDLDYVAPSYFQYEYPAQPDGYPTIFTIEGSNLRVMPSSNSPLEMVYNQRSPALASSLNWLFTNHYDAYLFGSLVEANAFNKGKAFESAALWKARRDEVFDEIQRMDFNERQGMAIRVLGLTP